VMDPLDLAAFELEALQLGRDALIPYMEWGALQQDESRKKVRAILKVLGIELDRQGVPIFKWQPMETARKDKVLLLLARIDGSEPGGESPVIDHFFDGDWHTLSYYEDPMYRLICLGWMERPEFVMARGVEA
jgi:hypothetical protein